MTATLWAALPDIEQLAPVPPVPTTLQETGLSFDTVEQLLIKTLYGAESTGLSLADRMRLPFTLLEPIIERVRAELLVEVRGSAGSGAAGGIATPHRCGARACDPVPDVNQHIGAAPVPLSVMSPKWPPSRPHAATWIANASGRAFRTSS
jgi:hypothetical protein